MSKGPSYLQMSLLKYLAPSSAPSFTYKPDYGTCGCATLGLCSLDNSYVLILTFLLFWPQNWYICYRSKSSIKQIKTSRISYLSVHFLSFLTVFPVYSAALFCKNPACLYLSLFPLMVTLPGLNLLVVFLRGKHRLHSKWFSFFAWGYAEVIHQKAMSVVFPIPWFSIPDCRQAAVLSPQDILVVFNCLLL